MQLDEWAKEQIGTAVLGRYVLDRIVGFGSTSVVYAATRPGHRDMAAKILPPDLSSHDGLVTRFRRSRYEAPGNLHRGVLRVAADGIRDDGTPFLLMELLAGRDVETLRSQHGGCLAAAHATELTLRVLDVLTAAHARGVVHGDIKPSKLFVTNAGTLKVLGFGAARFRALAAFARGEGAPDKSRAGAEVPDGMQGDLLAAGATLWTLLAGTRGSAPLALAPMALEAATNHIPQPVLAVVARALALDESERWWSAMAMYDALQAASVASFGGPPPT